MNANNLFDFKELSPAKMSIECGIVYIESIFDFSSITSLFAFSHIANSVGYCVKFKQEDIEIGKINNDMVAMEIISRFLVAGRDTSGVY